MLTRRLALGAAIAAAASALSLRDALPICRALHEVQDRPAPLRVELDAEQRSARDRRHERPAVLGDGQHGVVGRGRRVTRERVHEVEVGAVPDPGEQGMLLTSRDLVPADVRQGRCVLQAGRPPPEEPQRVRPVLIAAIEQHLEAQTDPQERLACRHPGTDRVHEAVALQARHRRGRGAHARHDERVRAAQRLAVAGDRDLRADARERLIDADQVPGAMVDDGDANLSVDPRWRRHPSEPLVDATPSRRGSDSQARRRARATALNAASAR